jgi:hypothetical protein
MFLSWLQYSSTLKMEAKCCVKTWLPFNELHGIIFKKPELFTTTGVRTSNPTQHFPCLKFFLRIKYVNKWYDK